METILILLLICSVMTSLITEAIKKMVPVENYSKNILAAVVSVIVSIAVCVGYLILTHTDASPEIMVYVMALIVMSWLCAMLGYDKVVQTLTQIHTKKIE